MITFCVLFLTACVEFYLFTLYLEDRTSAINKTKVSRSAPRPYGYRSNASKHHSL